MRNSSTFDTFPAIRAKDRQKCATKAVGFIYLMVECFIPKNLVNRRDQSESFTNVY